MKLQLKILKSINTELSSINKLSGNSLSKSQSCVFIGQLDSQQTIPDPKGGNVTSTPKPFAFGAQFLLVQTQTFIYENFNFHGQVHRFWF